MWVASKFGFFSIVKKDGNFHIRARVLSDLEELRRAVPGLRECSIHETRKADYRFRIVIPDSDKQVFMEVFAVLGASVDYGNFKDMIGRSIMQADKKWVYAEIWHQMHQYQQRQR